MYYLYSSTKHAYQLVLWVLRFLSTLSLRRATLNCSRNGFAILYFYPRSPCGERLTEICEVIAEMTISIHALLAESDSMLISLCCGCSDFYPRSPCGERPPRGGFCYLDNIISIHALLAESDGFGPSRIAPGAYFYPRSPCGERLVRIMNVSSG